MCRPALLSGLLLLAGCGGAAKEVPPSPPEDAAVSEALADPILTDPDLVSQNGAYAAVAVSGPASSALPPIDRSAAAIGAARDAAARLLGGMAPALPEPVPTDLKPFREAVTPAQMASAAGVASAACIGQAEYTARWAALLPEPLQVYPRGAVEDAAGTDAGSCALRVVHFKTPVAPDDVVAFHFARLRAAGYAVQYRADGGDRLLRGRKGAAGFAVYVRKAEDGLTAAAIVIAGS